ncbi:MAG: NAD(P)-dependent glycerol-3-phosphate dehydrogenase [Alphaproteobacteria bacterium]|nr:NAD(P)-dependent glycerol-3-phosphate dehydrogenase [Alphaproteobacteria bacterium]
MGMEHVGIVGAGAWGTALAVTATRAGRRATLWAHEPEVARAIDERHENPLYLPGVALPPEIAGTTDLAVLAGADIVVLVPPAQHLRSVCKGLAPHWRRGTPALIGAKGIEEGSFLLLTEVLAEALPEAVPAVLSGPTFAAEVARGLPTAVSVACADQALGRRMVEALGTPSFRPYWGDDPLGAQIGGAVKNVLAIACGIVAGRQLGDNARAALLTRGLAEILRLAEAKGGRRETLMGLSGLGDLILTATSTQSRNTSLGMALGEGRSLDSVLSERRTVAEGVYTARSVIGLANRLGVEMPLCEAVDAVLHRGADLDETIRGLLARPFKAEIG